METSQIAGSNSGVARVAADVQRKMPLKEELGQLRKAAGEFMDKKDEYVKDVELMVRRRPLTSVAVVAGVSAMVGALVTRLVSHPAK